MATRRQVERAILKQHPRDAVLVFDGNRPDMPLVGKRDGLDGGGGVLVLLDPDPDALGIRAGSIGLQGVKP
jgi:hypothetical protein